MTVEGAYGCAGGSLWIGAYLARDEAQKQRYEQLRDLVRDVCLDRRALQNA